MYNLDPSGDGVIIGHFEGHKRKIASNHADPGHWFPKHGKSMDTFRMAIKSALDGASDNMASESKTAVKNPQAPVSSGAWHETYTVKKGDTLWGIAAAKLGSGSRHTEIKALNNLKSDIITIGQVLKIPKK